MQTKITNKAELDRWKQKTHKQICRLYAGYTPIREIEYLLHILEIAYQNELKKLEMKG